MAVTVPDNTSLPLLKLGERAFSGTRSCTNSHCLCRYRVGQGACITIYITPAIHEGCTRSLRISHTSRRAPLQPVPKTQVPCTPYHPPNIAGVGGFSKYRRRPQPPAPSIARQSPGVPTPSVSRLCPCKIRHLPLDCHCNSGVNRRCRRGIAWLPPTPGLWPAAASPRRPSPAPPCEP